MTGLPTGPKRGKKKRRRRKESSEEGGGKEALSVKSAGG